MPDNRSSMWESTRLGMVLSASGMGREKAWQVMEMRQQREPPVVVAVDLGDEPPAFSHSEVVRDNNGTVVRLELKGFFHELHMRWF